MEQDRIKTLTDNFENVRLAVVGDFFLDRYLVIDPEREELSLETDLPAHQVVDKRCQPGAAGTVSSNLSALGVGTMHAVGVIGDDGEGYDLRRGLKDRRVHTDNLIVTDERFTPTYTKPMRMTPEGEVEMERQDIKNITPLPAKFEDDLLARLEKLLPDVDAVILLDQVEEKNCGVLTDRVRTRIAELGQENPDVVFFADSRCRIGLFRNVCIKPNRVEATCALSSESATDARPDNVSDDEAIEAARRLVQRNGRTVFLTLNEKGIAVVTDETATRVPGVHVTGPIDIVGAGDSVTAGIVTALSAGASAVEAAVIGNTVASVTIQQLGTTGICTIPQLHEAFEEASSQFTAF